MTKIIKENIADYFILTILITLVLGGRAFNSIAIFSYAVFFIYNLITSKIKISYNRLSFALILFYLFCSSSLIWTENIKNTKEALIRFLPYLILSTIAFLNFRNKIILKLFSKYLVLVCYYCICLGIYKSILYSDITFLFYHKLSGNLGDVNAIYLSVFVSFSISFFLYKSKKTLFDKFGIFSLFLFLILLSSKMILIITIINSSLFFIKNKNFCLDKRKTVVLIISGFLLVLASFNLSKRVKVEFEKTQFYEVLNTKDFGHVYIWTGSGLRVFQIKLFFEILNEKEKYFFGFGLNASQESLVEKYKSYNLYPGFYYYNYHNQYLQTFSELGIIGFLLLFYIFFCLINHCYNTKNLFLLTFVLLILFVCLTETFLWRQRGMVFFITISLLLYNRKIRIIEKEPI